MNDTIVPIVSPSVPMEERGLTKREEFVKAAMQGLCANAMAWKELSVDAQAQLTVTIADATIAAMNQAEEK